MSGLTSEFELMVGGLSPDTQVVNSVAQSYWSVSP